MHKISQDNTFFQGLDLCAMVAALQSNRLGVLITQGERGLSIGQACGICMPSLVHTMCMLCVLQGTQTLLPGSAHGLMADVRGERLGWTSDLPALGGTSLLATLSDPPCAASSQPRADNHETRWIAAAAVLRPYTTVQRCMSQHADRKEKKHMRIHRAY
jgi:hypothetical protein